MQYDKDEENFCILRRDMLQYPVATRAAQAAHAPEEEHTVGETNALTQLCSGVRLYHAERRIADYILEHLEETVGMTSAELAKASGSSEATMTRLCKKLGFGSYRAFQLALSRDVTEERRPGEISDEISLENIDQSLKNILANKIGELSATINGLDPKTLETVVALLRSAQIIEVAAVGNTIPVAMDATFKFNQLGLRAVTAEITERAFAFTLGMTERDAVLLISNSGRSKRLYRMGQIAKDNGVPVILITGDRTSPLTRVADYVLLSSNWERLLTTKTYALSRISATAIVEVLYSFLLVSLPNAWENIRRHQAMIEEDKALP